MKNLHRLSNQETLGHEAKENVAFTLEKETTITNALRLYLVDSLDHPELYEESDGEIHSSDIQH
jgi:hypothetical protein